MSGNRASTGSLVAGLLLVTLAACSPADPPSWDGSRALLSGRSALDAAAVVRPARPAEPPDPGCAQVLGLLGDFRRNLATRRPPDEVLETMSSCLTRGGRQLELLDLLRDALAAHPGDHGLELRLAAAFVELGDGDEALRRVAAVRQVAPDEPEALFLEGLALSRRPGASVEQLRRARDAWTRLLQVAPEHKGMGRFPPELVQRDLKQLEQELAGAQQEEGKGAAPPDEHEHDDGDRGGETQGPAPEEAR